jgi:hypothetical protein
LNDLAICFRGLTLSPVLVVPVILEILRVNKMN